MMMKPNLLLTGATGFVGSRVLITSIEAGYSVRCIVRSQTKANELLSIAALKNLTSKVSITVISDFSVPDAFDQAFEGIVYVIHVASPIPGPGKTDWEKDLIEPAVNMTNGILVAAQRTPTIKRVVITSSVAGIVPYSILTFGDPTDRTWTPDDRIPIDRGPYQNAVQAYNASKAMALEVIAQFMETHQPPFDVINIFPGWVIGRNIRAKNPTDTVSGTNWAALGNVFGHHSTRAAVPIVGHVDDVARAHLLALTLDPNHHEIQNLAVFVTSDWSSSLEIIKRNFPEAVHHHIFPLTGNQPNLKLSFNSSASEERLGFKFSSFEEQVVSVAAHYLEELAKPGATPVDPDGLQI